MKILVIGDSCKDVFHYGEVSRLAPEAPVPILNVTHTIQNHGMAGNVYTNLINYVKSEELDVSIDLRTNDNWDTITKTRFVDDNINYMLLRVDQNDFTYSKCDITDLDFKQYDLVVVSDYNKGFLSLSDLAIIAANSKLSIIDTKRILNTWVNEFSYLKINSNEYKQNKDYVDKFLSDKTIVTLGRKGCSFKGEIFPVEEVDIKDLAGAGDSFLAGLSLYFVLTGNIRRAIERGNEFATRVVQKRGVCSV